MHRHHAATCAGQDVRRGKKPIDDAVIGIGADGSKLSF